MKRSAWISVLAAGGLLVAGCSSGSDTAASATIASTTASSSSSSSESEESTTEESTTEESTTDESTSGGSTTDTSASVAPAELDPATQNWFTTFCAGVADATQYTSPDTTGQTLSEAQSTVVTAYSNLSASAAKLSADLQTTPPPTITGGSELSSGLATGFQGLADVYGRGSQTLAALTPGTEADLKSAIDAVEEEAKGVDPGSLPDLDPGVEAAVEQIPECSGIGG